MDGTNDLPLMKSGISEEIWKLMPIDPEKFKAAAKERFAVWYPGFTIVRAIYSTRTIYLRDDRRRAL